MSKYEVHRTDNSEPLIIEAMRAAGATVKKIGRPLDLLVAIDGMTALGECKTGNRQLQVSQVEFIDSWPGVAAVLRTPEDGIALVRLLREQARVWKRYAG